MLNFIVCCFVYSFSFILEIYFYFLNNKNALCFYVTLWSLENTNDPGCSGYLKRKNKRFSCSKKVSNTKNSYNYLYRALSRIPNDDDVA